MSSSSRIKTGVVGIGALGQHHVRKYAAIPASDLIGLVDIDQKRANELAAELNCRVFPDLESFAAEVEAASVAVPTHLHHAVAGQLIDAGLHLLIEKPIAASTAEAEDLVNRAAERELILQVGHIERFNPVLSAVEAMETAPRFIEASRLANFPAPRDGLPPRGTEVNVVLDLMIHDLEVILHIVRSPVKDVRAVGLPVLTPSEDIANVRLAFENGCVANVTASRISAERMRKIRLFYDHAYVSLDYQEQAGEIARIAEGQISRETIPIERGDALTRELSSFVDCVVRRQEPVVSGRAASEALQLAVEITARLREGSS